jgi:hypothetical protein
MPTLSIDWQISPRIIIVDAPDTEISAQQIVDLCRDVEDQTDNIGYAKLVNAAGKEDLGGGTTVGITLELQNARIGFEDRTTKLESGTVTTPDTTGKILTDSTATFQTNNVEIGDLVVNITDGSHATIIEVTGEDNVKTTGLSGGTDNQFASSDAYEVWEVIPCSITGGNVVAVDDVGAAMEPLFPTFGVYAIVSKASTGTLQEQEDVRHASFDGKVHVDVSSSQTGDAYPSGNSANPVNNWPDAVIINAREGFNQYSVERSTTLDNAEDFTDASFVGKSIIDTVLTVPAGTTLSKAEFFNVSLEGALGDTTIMQQCFLGETNELTDVRGVIEECSIGPAKLTLGGTSSGVVRFVNCRGAGSNFSPPTINCGGDGPEVDIQDYVGQLNIENKTGASVFEVSITGKLTLDSTVTNGTIIVNGAGTLEDNSGDGATVINNMIQGIHLQELWKLHGLEFGNPMTVTPTTRSVFDSSINLALTGDGVSSTVVTRTTDQTVSFDAPLTADLLDDSDGNLTPTFTRASTATYFDSGTGLIMSAAVDTPRFELEGLLIEEERLNQQIRSQEFDHAAWTNDASSITANAATAPDGTMTADKLVENSGVGPHRVKDAYNLDTASVPHTGSLFVKAAERFNLAFGLFNNTDLTWATARVDYSNGTMIVGAEPDARVTQYPNNWWRVEITGTPSTVTNNQIIITLYADDGVTRDYTGNGSSGIYLWGAQVEEGEFATSYIPTTDLQVTRSADYLSYNNDSPVFDAAGTVICDITPLYADTYGNDSTIINVEDQQVGPLYILDDTTNKFAIGDGTTVGTYDHTFARNTTVTVASRWSSTTMQTLAGGFAGTEVAYDAGFTRTAGTLYVGSDSTGNHINGNIKSLKIYNVDRGETQLLVDTG